MPSPPPAPSFTSTPPTAAEEATAYTYTVAATSPDGGGVTFALTSGPDGAMLAGNTLTWTPTDAESRMANAFTVTATTAKGGSATQNWSVTPNGTVNVTAVTSYWGPNGNTDVPPTWLSDVPFPAALVPQSDGSLQRLQGSANADGSFSIPNVPGGYYWLQINLNANYWTSTSDFDDGFDVIGQQGARTTQNTTTFNYLIGQSAPSGGITLINARTNVENLDLVNFAGAASFNQISFSNTITSPDDWSKITTIYLNSYESTSTGGFNGFTLYSAQTLSDVTIVDGAANSITANLALSPPTSVPLSIQGSAWANEALSVGPNNPVLTSSDYAVYAQPYLTTRIGTGHDISIAGPDLTMLRPQTSGNSLPVSPSPFLCTSTTGPFVVPELLPSASPIITDVNYGMVTYGDPYPSEWPRIFQYCEVSTVSLPRPNSSTVDTFYVVNKQATGLPSGQVSPLLTPVQSPTINGASFFAGGTLNTTDVTINWSAPAVGQPYGYYVTVYTLLNSEVSSLVGYAPDGRYGTAQTSVNIPGLTPGTYVFIITAEMDAEANMEKQPQRSKLPSGETGVVSAPVVIASGATATKR